MQPRELVEQLQKALQRLRNTLESNHKTDDLTNCHNCGKKPARYWSHWGSWIVCKCGQMIYAGLGNKADVGELWDNMNERREN